MEKYSGLVHHMDNSSDERADRLLKRNAAKDARELEATLTEDAQASATMTEPDRRTVADYAGSSLTMATRKPEVKSDTDEKRPHTSSDYLFTSAPSQHYQPSVRTVPDSFAPPAFTGANIDAGSLHRFMFAIALSNHARF